MGDYQQFKRGVRGYKPYTLFAWAQPFPAITAVAGCLVVLGFCSATWWNSPVTFAKVAIGYTAVSISIFTILHTRMHILTEMQPFVFFSLLIVFKLINRRLWVRTSNDFTPLSQTLDRLKLYKPDETPVKRKNEEATRVLSLPQASPNLEDHSTSTFRLA